MNSIQAVSGANTCRDSVVGPYGLLVNVAVGGAYSSCWPRPTQSPGSLSMASAVIEPAARTVDVASGRPDTATAIATMSDATSRRVGIRIEIVLLTAGP